jgi:hypothetical protein
MAWGSFTRSSRPRFDDETQATDIKFLSIILLISLCVMRCDRCETTLQSYFDCGLPCNFSDGDFVVGVPGRTAATHYLMLLCILHTGVWVPRVSLLV